jgi:hypothetical protein
VVPGPGVDGFFHFKVRLRTLQEWGLLEIFKVEVLEETAG